MSTYVKCLLVCCLVCLLFGLFGVMFVEVMANLKVIGNVNSGPARVKFHGGFYDFVFGCLFRFVKFIRLE